MNSDSLDRAWDPTAPGSGALRATAIAQLYFRMTSHHPLTILVVDAMCLTFAADGATVQELVDYLGITEDRIRFALDAIPAEMRCTSLQLETEAAATAISGASIDTITGRTKKEGKVDAQAGARRSDADVRHFLNYKRLLPVVYAHVVRLLLSTCVVDVPPCSYVASVRAAQLASYRKSGEGSTAHAMFTSAPASTTATGAAALPATAAVTASAGNSLPAVEEGGEHIEVSDAMRRKAALQGVYCLGCSCYFLVEEFNTTLSCCPRCSKDTLRLCIQSLQRHLTARAAAEHTLVKLLPSVGQVWKRNLPALVASSRQQSSPPTAPEKADESPVSATGTKAQQQQQQQQQPSSTTAMPHLRCTLARDPFLFQQALAFLFLYSARFASVNDAASVVDAQHILTEPEYRDRLRGRASLADQFRSRHRHASSIRVRVVSQHEVDAARQAESHRKLLKRAMLPPWLRHTSALEALGGSHTYRRTAGQAQSTGDTRGGAVDEAQEPWESEQLPNTSEIAKGSSTLHGGAVWARSTAAPSVKADKRQRATAADPQAQLTRAADFVAVNYYDDEFDEVVLPLSRPRWK